MVLRPEDVDVGFELGDAAGSLDALIRHSGDCIKVIDLDGRVTKWSPACEDVYGWSASEVLGQKLPHIPVELRPRVTGDLRNVAASGRVAERAVESQRADGTRLNVQIALIPLVDGDGDAAGVLTVAREILGDERLYRQRDELLAFLGRGLREPLAAIESAARLLLRPEIAGNAERRARLATTIAEKAHAAVDLADDLVVTSDLIQGTLVLRREASDVVAVVSAAVEAFGDRSRRIMVDFDSPLPSVSLDSRRMVRVVRVLVGKAFEQVPEGESVQVSVLGRGSEVAIRVRDRGRKADEAEIGWIFEQRGLASASERLDDLGIGMFLVSGIVAAHGGRVLASNHAGMTCTVVLPAVAT